MRKRKRSNRNSKVISALYDLTGLGLIVGGLVMLVTAGYLAYGIQSGVIQKFGTMPGADRLRVINNIAFTCRIFGTASLITVISAVIRYYVEETLGYALSLGGALLYFVPPIALAGLATPNIRASSIAVGMLSSQAQATGLLMLAPGLMLVLRDLLGRLIRILTRPRIATGLVWGKEDRQNISPIRRAYGRCWDLPHCREFIRKICPAYTAGHSCWRVKQGCYCDEKTIVRAMEIRGAGADVVKNAQFSHGFSSGRQNLSGAQKRQRCRNCAIYSEHQRQKYRVISPLVFPTVAIAIWLVSPNIQSLIQSVVLFTDRFMKLASYTPQASMGPSAWTYYTSGAGTIQWLFIVWLSIMAIGYTLQLMEYFIFKVQI
jgi:hypothetical protein